MTSAWEIAAVVLALLYLIFAIRQNILCWAAAMGSTMIYMFVMYNAALYMESALQIFYLAMAIFGWWSWRVNATSTEPAVSAMSKAVKSAGDDLEFTPLKVQTRPWQFHARMASIICLLTAGSGFLLSRYSDAALPFADAFTTWAAIVTTYMVAKKILENWLYWFVIDTISVFLYINRGLYLTAALFVVYLVLIVLGYRAWKRSMVGKATVPA